MGEFTILINGLNITFTEQKEADIQQYNIKTEYDDFAYECKNMMKPVGKKGIDILERFLNYEDTSFNVKYADDKQTIKIIISHIILDEDITILLHRENISEFDILKRDIKKIHDEQNKLKDEMSGELNVKINELNENMKSIDRRISNIEGNTQFQIMTAKKIYVTFDGEDLYISDPDLEKYLIDAIINKDFLIKQTKVHTPIITEGEWMLLNNDRTFKNLSKVFARRSVFYINEFLEIILKSKQYIITSVDHNHINNLLIMFYTNKRFKIELIKMNYSEYKFVTNPHKIAHCTNSSLTSRIKNELYNKKNILYISDDSLVNINWDICYYA